MLRGLLGFSSQQGNFREGNNNNQWRPQGVQPKYAKYLKDLITNKRKLEVVSTVILNEECSAIVHKDMPKKLKDPGSFNIAYFIGDLRFNRALADFGASIN